MKRAVLLLMLVTLVGWLAQSSSASDTRDPGKTTSTLNAAASNAALNAPLPQDTCCVDPNQTDPHWECFDGACVQVSGCGTSVNCASCGCSSSDEWACISNGGYWDPYACFCDYGCDPTGSQQGSCVAQGGYWDSYYCTCNFPCDPTGSQRQACISAGREWDSVNCICHDTDVCVCYEAELIGYEEYYYDYCDGYYYVYCTDAYYTYYQECDGNCGSRQWTENDFYCYSYGEYCGGGGDPGGGGDCWYTGDCWCDDWWGICCEWDYCYEMEMGAQ